MIYIGLKPRNKINNPPIGFNFLDDSSYYLVKLDQIKQKYSEYYLLYEFYVTSPKLGKEILDINLYQWD